MLWQIIRSLWKSIFRFARCRWCGRFYHVTDYLLDHYDRGWAHCPYCYGMPRPPGIEGADGMRIRN